MRLSHLVDRATPKNTTDIAMKLVLNTLYIITLINCNLLHLLIIDSLHCFEVEHTVILCLVNKSLMTSNELVLHIHFPSYIHNQ